MTRHKQFLYGVGTAIIEDFYKPEEFVTQADLQDLSIECSVSFDDVTAANKIFPIVSFPKDKSIKVSATNATFDAGIMRFTEGSEPVTGIHKFPVVMSFTIPADGVVTLEHVPSGNVLVKGFTAVTGDAEPAAGKFKVDTATKQLKFAVADAGKLANVLYYKDSSEKCIGYESGMKTKQKPFAFKYLYNTFDEDTNEAARLLIEVYKMQMTTGFSLDTKHQTAFAPKWEAQAKDPNRPDGKLWALYLDEISID